MCRQAVLYVPLRRLQWRFLDNLLEGITGALQAALGALESMYQLQAYIHTRLME